MSAMESRTREICERVHLERKSDFGHRTQLALAVSQEGVRGIDNDLSRLHISWVPHWLTIIGNQIPKNSSAASKVITSRAQRVKERKNSSFLNEFNS